MGNQAEATNYYEVLEIPHDAPPHEIHRAYQRAKSTYSSENPALYSMFSPDEARELLRMIEEAYSVLGNPGLRKNYDETRGSQPQRSQPFPTMNFEPTSAPAGYTASSYKEQTRDIVSVHQALPDFTSPTAPPTSSQSSGRSSGSFVGGSGPRIVSSATPRAPLAPGMARTSLSTYKVDDAFESEVNGAIDWDGTFLQRVRLYKNISIDALSEATRISRAYLMAVETNDFKNLPAAVYVRGFVVQIARILGLSDNKIASSYLKIFKAGGGK